MYARAVEDAAVRLRELRRAEIGELGVAALALVLAVVAARVYPPLAIPFLAGGVAVGASGVKALWQRWDLVERLAGERDAYVIPDVLAYASREVTMERRRSYAALIRLNLTTSTDAGDDDPLVEELEALASELEYDGLMLDPACGVACMRLLSDLAGSPLLNPDLRPKELRSRVRQIRSGLAPAGVPPDPRAV